MLRSNIGYSSPVGCGGLYPQNDLGYRVRHPRTDPVSEITKVEAHEIKQWSAAGMKQTDIAKAIGCSERTVRNVLRGEPAQRDERADMHDRMLGSISSGCYDKDGEQAIFEDPTCDWAERIEFLEKNIDVEVLDSKED
jgi:predicted transcriptional regulator